MLSSTIDTFQRGDESSTCRTDNELTRIEPRLAPLLHADGLVKDDVETLSPEQM